MTNSAAALPAPKSSKKWLVIGALLALVLAGAGAAAWFFLSSPRSSQEVAVSLPTPPTFYALAPFTVNLNDDSGRMLHIGLNLELDSASSVEQLNTYLPSIRNSILLLLTGKPPAEFESTDGKRQLAEELRTLISQPVDGAERIAVRQVLFTDLIVQ